MSGEVVPLLSTLRGTDKDALVRIVVAMNAQIERLGARIEILERRTGDESAARSFRGFA